MFLWQFAGSADQCGLLVFGVFSEHAPIILNFCQFEEGGNPFCSGIINPQSKTLILGAGLSGLIAGKYLQEAGHSISIVEKSRGVGGRMATRRFQNGVFDHGAQFFTARDSRFQYLVDNWIQAGVLKEWTRGFPQAGISKIASDHPRYRGQNGMTDVAKKLAGTLNVHLQTRITSVSTDGYQWIAITDDKRQFVASRLILTSPVPQSLKILEAGSITLPQHEHLKLKAIEYDPCIALLVLLQGKGNIPAPGGLQFDTGPIQWISDNTQKGISPDATAITIHASPAYSRENFDADPESIALNLLKEAKPWVFGDVLDMRVHKWRYSRPMEVYPDPFMQIPGWLPLFFAGDAFGGPRVEGAALSGIAVARHLLKADG